MGQSGVIAGRFQLGIRVHSSDSRLQVRPCTWRVDQVPKSWTFDEVNDLLQTFHFSHIEVIAKEWRRDHTSWLVRAQYSEPNELLLQPVIAIHDGLNLEL